MREASKVYRYFCKGVLTALLLLAGCSGSFHYAEIYNTDGKLVGSADFSETLQGVLIAVQISGLAPGVHGFHIHNVGVCRGDFSSAGPHFNPEGKEHGMRNPKGPHAGDLPNIRANDDGVVRTEVAASVRMQDIVGHSLVIHEAADDQLTDPAGTSGARIACGVIV